METMWCKSENTHLNNWELISVLRRPTDITEDGKLTGSLVMTWKRVMEKNPTQQDESEWGKNLSKDE